jgi:hypothetical protein
MREEKMTEAEWLGCDDPERMLEFVQGAGTLSERKARLFAVACSRHVWHLLDDERSRRAVEVAEQWRDGIATAAELSLAHSAAGVLVNSRNHWGVARFAHTIHEQRKFEDLSMLTDASEEVGCSDAELLGQFLLCYPFSSGETVSWANPRPFRREPGW